MLGYLFCCISYLICGTIGLFGFFGTDFTSYYYNSESKVVHTQIIA